MLLGRADFFSGGLLRLHARAAQSVTRAEGGLARARQIELTRSFLERAKNSCRQWRKRSVCGRGEQGGRGMSRRQPWDETMGRLMVLFVVMAESSHL